MAHRFPSLVVLLALVFADGTSALAQVQTGSILVRSVDEQGAVLPGVTVTISSPAIVAGQMTGVTDAGGVLRFPSLSPGIYLVKFELPGFQTVIRENLLASLGQTTTLDVVMRVATIEETVTVKGESPVVDTTSASVNYNITQQMLQGTPGGRDVWSLMEYKVPGLVMNRPDVGGAEGGQQGSYSARGTSHGQNVHFLNGVNITSPSAIGGTNLYYDYDALDEVQVSTGATDLSVPSAGVFLNMVNKTGTDQFRGRVFLSWQGHQVQAANVDDSLSKFGLRPAAGAVEALSDVNLQLGGPIIRNKLRFFGSYRDWQVERNIPGFPELESVTYRTPHVNGSWQVNAKNRVTGYLTRQTAQKPNRDASALRTPESTSNQNDVFWLRQVWWNSVLSDRAFVDVRFSQNDLLFRLFQKGEEQTLLDLSTNLRSRSAANQSIFPRLRYQTNVVFQYFLDQALGGRHEFRAGIDHSQSPAQAIETRIDDLELAYRSLPVPTASTVTLFNTPLHSRQALDVTALFVQDAYTIGRLTVTGGLRWERLEGYLPEQSSPPSRWFPDAVRSFDAIRNVISWKGVAPRVSVVYDLFGKGKTALKVGAGRYLYTVATGEPTNVSPNFRFSETYAWNDLNGDLKFQVGEQGAFLSRSGTTITSYASGIRRPYTDELSGGVDHELVPTVRLSVVFSYRRERDLYGSQDVGVPLSAYSQVSVPDLGRDGLPGTADDGTILMWDQDPATRGQNRFVIDNSSVLNQTYRGVEMSVAKRFSNRWQMLAGYTLSKGIVNSVNVRTPNALINSRGPGAFDRTHIFKLSGSYVLPYDISVSGNFRSQTGLAVTRTATLRLTQGNVTVNMEPSGSQRLDPLTTADARVSKSFKVKAHDLELLLDAYNLANSNTVWGVRTLTGRINVREGGSPTGAVINQPQFLSPTEILAPRIFKLSVAYRF